MDKNAGQQMVRGVVIHLNDDFTSLLDYTSTIGPNMGDALLAWLMQAALLSRRVELFLPSLSAARQQRRDGSALIDAVLSGLDGGVLIRKNEQGVYDVSSHT